MPSLTFANVDLLCGNVNCDGDTLVVDLRRITFFEPFALIYLGMFLRHYVSCGKVIQVRPPTDAKAKGYLARQKFWERFNFDPRTLSPDLLRTFTTATSLNDIVDIPRRQGIAEDVAEAVVNVLCPGPRPRYPVDVGAVGEMVSELVHNFQEHSEGPLAAFTMQWYPRATRLALAIGDCGIGIRQALSSAEGYRHLAEQPHRDAAYLAFQAGVTSRSTGGGTGLWEVATAVDQLGGWVRLATGNGYVHLQGEDVRVGDMAFDLTGVQVEVSIPGRR